MECILKSFLANVAWQIDDDDDDDMAARECKHNTI